MLKHILRFVVGWGVILMILAMTLANSSPLLGGGHMEPGFDNGLQNAWELISLSIVCTFGISLIIWIPFGYIVGLIAIYGVSYIVLGIIYLVALVIEPFTVGSLQRLDPQKGRLLLLTDRLNQELQSGFSLNREQLALLNYIKKARTKGLNDEQISQNLTTNGWPTNTITAAFQMARNGA